MSVEEIRNRNKIREIDKAFDAIIGSLARERAIHDESEQQKDLEFCRKYFEDIDAETVRIWTAIIIVHSAHNLPKESTKLLMLNVVRQRKSLRGKKG